MPKKEAQPCTVTTIVGNIVPLDLLEMPGPTLFSTVLRGINQAYTPTLFKGDVIKSLCLLQNHVHAPDLKFSNLPNLSWSVLLLQGRINALIEDLGLSQVKHTRIADLTSSEKQRLNVACHLLLDTDIVILDQVRLKYLVLFLDPSAYPVMNLPPYF